MLQPQEKCLRSNEDYWVPLPNSLFLLKASQTYSYLDGPSSPVVRTTASLLFHYFSRHRYRGASWATLSRKLSRFQPRIQLIRPPANTSAHHVGGLTRGCFVSLFLLGSIPESSFRLSSCLLLIWPAYWCLASDTYSAGSRRRYTR